MRIVMIGGTGAVGGEVVRALVAMPAVRHVTVLGRRELTGIDSDKLRQEVVDVLSPESYQGYLSSHDVGISTFGVGQPSGMSNEEFTRIDRDAVVNFAVACKASGVGHFQSLGSVGTSATSKNFYLRSKGQLEAELQDLAFERLSLFHPSMILTPTNRYGIMQAITLRVWPVLSHLFLGPMRKLRGIRSEELGNAIAHNILGEGRGAEVLEWSEIRSLSS